MKKKIPQEKTIIILLWRASTVRCVLDSVN